MSLLTNQVSANQREFLFLTATGQQLNVSTLNANNVNANNISTAAMTTSSVTATTVDVDGQVLTATPTELLLNGVPLATTSNLSSIADWAYDPAISTVQMNGNNLIGASNISSLSINATNAVFQNLIAWNSIFVSSYTSTISTVSTRAEEGSFSSLTTGHLSAGICDLSDVSANLISANSGLFSTLWGQPSSFYQPYALTPNPEFSTIRMDASGYISTPQLYVSSINGSEFTSTGITVQVAGVSSLVANTVSSIGAELRTALVSTLQFNPSFSPNLDVNLGLGSLFGNLAGAASGALGVLVGGAALGTGIAALSQSRQTNYINSNAYELVNGTTQLQVSTLAGPVSTIYRFVNSASPTTPGEEVFVSTITGTGTYIRSLSDPLNTVSSPNSTIQSFGQWVQLPDFPVASTVSTFSDLYTSSLRASTINFNNGTQLQRGAPWQGTGGVSTLELLWSDASPPLDADMRVGALVISGSDVGGINLSKDVLIQNANNGNRLIVYGAAGSGPSTIAYLSDIPPVPPTVSSFQTASISSATISSVNGGIPYTTANPPPVQPVVSSFATASVSSATISSINGGIPYTTLFPPAQTDTFSTIVVSTIKDMSSTINIVNGNVGSIVLNNAGDVITVATNYINLQTNNPVGAATAGLLLNASVNPQGSSSNYTNGPMYFNASSITVSTNQTAMVNLSTSVIGTSSLTFNGVSSINLVTAATAGTASQPIGRLLLSGCDLDLGQNDLWAQQVRIGAGNPTNAQSELIFYDAAAGIRTLQTALQDRTVRVGSTINTTAGGYLLDTGINPPFFSTIAGTSTALMAFFPSSINSTIGASTISVMPPLTYIASVYDSTTQTVAGANTATNTTWNTTSLNIGGFTIGNSTIGVPVAGVYELNASYQFATPSGGANLAQFWLTKNGSAVAQTNSRVSVANNADNLGTISIFDTAAAGDKYGFQFYSADAGMAATAVAAGATPAIPSIIFNAKRIG